MFNSRKPKAPRERFQGSGKISSIEAQKIARERVNIYLDGEYAFSLAEIVAAEFRLKTGQELSEETVAELQEADYYRQGLNAALNALAQRPRSEGELRTKLKRTIPEATSETLERVIKRLHELKYLDDSQFARFWTESRSGSSPHGSRFIKQELSAKGVDKEVIEEAVSEVLQTTSPDDEEGLTKEERQALDMALRKANSLRGEDWPGFYRKMGGFLARRGYGFDIVRRVTRRAWQEIKNEAPESDPDEDS